LYNELGLCEAADVFAVEERLARLSELGDQLEAFSQTVDFEVFGAGLFRRVKRRAPAV